MLDSFISRVNSKFRINQSDNLGKTLGFQIERMRDGGIFMHQKSYITDVIKRFGMENSNTVHTPFDPRICLRKSGSTVLRTGMSSVTTQ